MLTARQALKRVSSSRQRGKETPSKKKGTMGKGEQRQEVGQSLRTENTRKSKKYLFFLGKPGKRGSAFFTYGVIKRGGLEERKGRAPAPRGKRMVFSSVLRIA